MSSNNISLGKGKQAQTVDLAKFKGGIKREALKTEQEIAIFDALNNGGKEGDVVLDENEIAKFIEEFNAGSGKDGKVSKREAKKFLKEKDLKDIKPEDLFNFVKQYLKKVKLKAAKLTLKVTSLFNIMLNRQMKFNKKQFTLTKHPNLFQLMKIKT